MKKQIEIEIRIEKLDSEIKKFEEDEEGTYDNPEWMSLASERDTLKWVLGSVSISKA